MTTSPTPYSSATPEAVLLSIRDELGAIGVDGAKTFESSLRWNQIDIDSVELVELVAALEEEYGIDMVNEDYDELDSADALASRVSRLIADAAMKRVT